MSERKSIVGTVNGTPEKRLFRSIIADYDLRTGLCELIDNAIDHWLSSGKKAKLTVNVSLSAERQIIRVDDNAGGVKNDQLHLLVSPGASKNDPESSVIGIFGVGGKRAGVALGELVEIRTRTKSGKGYLINIDNDWLSSDDWEIDYYEIDRVPKGHTIVEISKLRQSFSAEDVVEIAPHLSQIYGSFIGEDCEIRLNENALGASSFEHWAYPPTYPPRIASFEIAPVEGRKLNVEISAGLIRDRDPETENYGVYVYCNDRLIRKELRTRDVGYMVTNEAGVPHPDASLCRVIVRLNGDAELMPWNSSKSDINTNHPAFLQIRPTVISLTTYYSKLSRRLKKDWPNQVFVHKAGLALSVSPSEISTSKRLILPNLPRARKTGYFDQLRAKNEKLLKAEPWILGLVESIGLIETLKKQKLETKNRISLILLDSNFEISLKEFIVHQPSLFPPHRYTDAHIAQLFKQRTLVLNDVEPHVPGLTALRPKAAHYYGLRNKLIHERTTAHVRDAEIEDYREVVEKAMNLLFGVKFPK